MYENENGSVRHKFRNTHLKTAVMLWEFMQIRCFALSCFLHVLIISYPKVNSFLDAPQVGKAKGVLKNFLIEPFVPHKQVQHSLFSLFKRDCARFLVKRHLLTSVSF